MRKREELVSWLGLHAPKFAQSCKINCRGAPVLLRPGNQRKKSVSSPTKRSDACSKFGDPRRGSSPAKIGRTITFFHWSAGARDGPRQWTYPMAIFLYHKKVTEIKTQYLLVK